MSQEAPPKPADICLARQPIFDRNRQVQGYELLYRGPMTDVTDEVEGRATATVLVNAFMEIGLPHLVGDKPCFINLNNSLLGSDMLSCLPADRVVFEILENTVATPESIARVRELRDRGFRIAIDDYVFQPSLDPFLNIADIVKLDVSKIDADKCRRSISGLRRGGRKLLAEKVETYEEFDRYAALGCEYFQGYYFMRPELLEGKLKTGNRAGLLGLITALRDPEIGLDVVSKLISADVTLSYRLLKFLHSAYISGPREVDSVRSAVAFLGLTRTAQMATILLLSSIENKPSELLVTALARARMAESLVPKNHPKREHFYCAGLFSVLDALLDQPMEQILEGLPLPADVHEALVDPKSTSEIATALRSVISYERGDWSAINASLAQSRDLGRLHVEAIQASEDACLHLAA
jgi:EAL and modified HD-GYP domain-containing signal transduction protein